MPPVDDSHMSHLMKEQSKVRIAINAFPLNFIPFIGSYVEVYSFDDYIKSDNSFFWQL